MVFPKAPPATPGGSRWQMGIVNFYKNVTENLVKRMNLKMGDSLLLNMITNRAIIIITI